MVMTAIFVSSALAFSGLVSAGKPPAPPAQTGTCVMDNTAYTLGQTITISATGTGGAGGTKTNFAVLLKNPSGTTVKSQTYTGTSFSGTVTYSLLGTDPTGTWTAQTNYNTIGAKGRVTTKVLATDTATVNPLPTQDFVAVGISTSPSQPIGDYPVTISYQISLNQVQWSGTVYTDLYIDNGPAYVDRHSLVYSPGMDLTYTYTYSTILATGTHSMRMFVDSTNVVPNEPNEGNNQLTVSYTWQAPTVSWNLMVYLCADSLNLNGGGFNIMNQILAATHASQVRTIVMMDPMTDWGANWGAAANSNARYYELFQGTYTLLQDLGEANMGSPSTLTDFVHFAEDRYPSATNYGLVLFDNGHSWPGVCFDNNPSDFLTMVELNQALKAAKTATGKSLSLIGISACLMQYSEIAYELRNLARVMVASEELEWPGYPTITDDAWPWTEIITDLSANFASDALWLGSNIVTEYKNQWQSDLDASRHSTISAIDLSLMYDLGRYGIGPLGVGLQNCIIDNCWTQIKAIREQTEEFSDDIAEAHERFIDLYDFADRIGQGLGSMIDVSTANAITYIKQNVVIGKVIINEWHRTGLAGDHVNAHGLGIYFPLKMSDYSYDIRQYYDYSSLLMSIDPAVTGWYGFVKKFISGLWCDEFSDSDISDWIKSESPPYNTVAVESGSLKLSKTSADSECSARHTISTQTGHLTVSARISVSTSDPNKWVYLCAMSGGQYVAFVMFKDGWLTYSDGHQIWDYGSNPSWYVITMDIDLVGGRCSVNLIYPLLNPNLGPWGEVSYENAPLYTGAPRSVDTVKVIDGNWPDSPVTTWVDYVVVTS